MSASTRKSSARLRPLVSWPVALMLLLVARQAAAICGTAGTPLPPHGDEDGRLIVCESAMNKFAQAVMPLSRSTDFSISIHIPNPFLIPPTINIRIDGTASATVTRLVFDVTEGAVTVSADALGQILGFPFQARMSSTVDVSIDPASESLIFSPGRMSVRPSITLIAGVNATLPFPINLNPSLAIPEMPLDAVVLRVQTPNGSRDMKLDAYDQEISRHNGFLELKSHVRVR